MLWTVFKVHPHKMCRQSSIRNFINLVENKVHKIKSGKESGWEIDILWNGEIGVIFTSNRIGGSKNASSGVECCDDSCFCNRDGLLFHNFVQYGSSTIGHLVEFINATDPTIRQDQCTTVISHCS